MLAPLLTRVALLWVAPAGAIQMYTAARPADAPPDPLPEGAPLIPDSNGCYVWLPSGCKSETHHLHAKLHWKRDIWGEENMRAAESEEACQARKESYDGFCRVRDSVMLWVSGAAPSTEPSPPAASQSTPSPELSPPAAAASKSAPVHSDTAQVTPPPSSQGPLVYKDGRLPQTAEQFAKGGVVPKEERDEDQEDDLVVPAAMSESQGDEKLQQRVASPPAPGSPGCWVWLPSGCDSKQHLHAKLRWRRDIWGEANRQARESADACNARKRDFDIFCNATDSIMLHMPKSLFEQPAPETSQRHLVDNDATPKASKERLAKADATDEEEDDMLMPDTNSEREIERAVAANPPAPSSPGCWVGLPSGCKSKRLMHAKLRWRRDTWGEANKQTRESVAACNARKRDFDIFCNVTDTVMLPIPKVSEESTPEASLYNNDIARASKQRIGRAGTRENDEEADNDEEDQEAAEGLMVPWESDERDDEGPSAPPAPNTTGCWFWMPSGCHSEKGHKVKAVKRWKRDIWGELNRQAGERMDKCYFRKLSFDAYCNVSDTFMLPIIKDTPPKTKDKGAEQRADASQGAGAGPNSPGCWVMLPSGCQAKNSMRVKGRWRRDVWGEANRHANESADACNARKFDFDTFCRVNDAIMLPISRVLKVPVGVLPPKPNLRQAVDNPRKEQVPSFTIPEVATAVYENGAAEFAPAEEQDALAVTTSQPVQAETEKQEEEEEQETRGPEQFPMEEEGAPAYTAFTTSQPVQQVAEQVRGAAAPPAPKRTGCWVLLPSGCNSDGASPRWRRDVWGERNKRTGESLYECLARKLDFDTFCHVADSVMAHVPPPALGEQQTAAVTTQRTRTDVPVAPQPASEEQTTPAPAEAESKEQSAAAPTTETPLAAEAAEGASAAEAGEATAVPEEKKSTAEGEAAVATEESSTAAPAGAVVKTEEVVAWGVGVEAASTSAPQADQELATEEADIRKSKAAAAAAATREGGSARWWHIVAGAPAAGLVGMKPPPKEKGCYVFSPSGCASSRFNAADWKPVKQREDVKEKRKACAHHKAFYDLWCETADAVMVWVPGA